MDDCLSNSVYIDWLGNWLGDVFVKLSYGQLMININDDVFMERTRQNEKWGFQRHSNERWLTILMEEIGECAEAMQKDTVSRKETDSSNLYEEIIQAAAVLSAWAEQVKEEMGNE